jgi:hypothetical protein
MEGSPPAGDQPQQPVPSVPPPRTAAVPAEKPPGAPGLAVAGFVLGLCGLVLTLSIFCWFIGLPAAIVGTVLSAIGLRQAGDRGAPRGLAIAGLSCGIVALALGIAVVLLVIFANLSTGIDEFDDGGDTPGRPAVVAPLLALVWGGGSAYSPRTLITSRFGRRPSNSV